MKKVARGASAFASTPRNGEIEIVPRQRHWRYAAISSAADAAPRCKDIPFEGRSQKALAPLATFLHRYRGRSWQIWRVRGRRDGRGSGQPAPPAVPATAAANASVPIRS